MQRIKFFTYYGCTETKKYRKSSPAADSKIDYIVDVLNRCGYDVDIISLAASSIDSFLPACVQKRKNNTLRYFASFRYTSSHFRIFNRWFMELQLFLWCLLNLKKNETIFVYHSLGYDSIFIKLKKLLNIRIIGEIEEIYQDVSTQKNSQQINEYKFIDQCDGYILPTTVLDNKINTSRKPSVIIHGVYNIAEKISEKYNDGKIHVVYGGTLDPNKGGALATVRAAEFLPENYHVHICGFGSSSEVQKEIEHVRKKSKATITFEGELKGLEYNKFIQKCHIGLSTQNPNAAFNETSFPSKILVYLSNGLAVVTVRIKVVEESSVNDIMYYYNKQCGKSIATAILSVDVCGIKNHSIKLKELDKSFQTSLTNILN